MFHQVYKKRWYRLNHTSIGKEIARTVLIGQETSEGTLEIDSWSQKRDIQYGWHDQRFLERAQGGAKGQEICTEGTKRRAICLTRASQTLFSRRIGAVILQEQSRGVYQATWIQRSREEAREAERIGLGCWNSSWSLEKPVWQVPNEEWRILWVNLEAWRDLSQVTWTDRLDETQCQVPPGIAGLPESQDRRHEQAASQFPDPRRWLRLRCQAGEWIVASNGCSLDPTRQDFGS